MNTRGTANGWTVRPDHNTGQWHWNAYSNGHSATGTTRSSRAADRAANNWLNRHQPTQPRSTAFLGLHRARRAPE